LSQGRKYLPTGIVCKTVTGTDYTNWGPSMAWCSWINLEKMLKLLSLT